MNLGLEGKYALVTGGSHGIGRAIAIELANEGCNVCIVARERSKLEETSSLIRGSTSADTLCIQEDVTDPSAIE